MLSFKKSIKQLAAQDSVLGSVIKMAKLKALRPRGNHFESLGCSIISQQLSSKASATIINRFIKLFGNTFPNPQAVLRMPDKKIRLAGLSSQKISYIKALAKAVKQGKVDFKTLIKLDDEAVISNLMQIKGIGRWTAEMFLIFSFARPDVFSDGDLGLRNAIKKLYNINPKLHNRKLAKIIESWKPHRSLASRHLWASLEL